MDEEYRERAPGYASRDEFYAYRDHYQETLDHIATRWSLEVERINYGDEEITRDHIVFSYAYDRYDERKYWYVPIAAFWNLDQEIEKAKAVKAEKVAAEQRRKDEEKEKLKAKHEAFIRSEAERLGLLKKNKEISSEV